MQCADMLAKIRKRQVLRFKLLDFHANRCAAESIIKSRSWICLWQTRKEIQCAQ